MKRIMKKTRQRVARHGRIRRKVVGTAECPRLCVFKSNTAIYAQLVDDSSGRVLGQADSRKQKSANLAAARKVGEAIGAAGLKAGIRQADCLPDSLKLRLFR